MNVPQAAAMGVCVMSRHFGRSRVHPDKCRYCPESEAALIAKLRDYGVGMTTEGSVGVSKAVQDEEAEYRRNSAAERERRLREAQALPEPQWYEEVAGA